MEGLGAESLPSLIWAGVGDRKGGFGVPESLRCRAQMEPEGLSSEAVAGLEPTTLTRRRPPRATLRPGHRRLSGECLSLPKSWAEPLSADSTAPGHPEPPSDLGLAW